MGYNPHLTFLLFSYLYLRISNFHNIEFEQSIIIVAPLTQGTLYSNNYVNTFRLVDMVFFSMELMIELFIYTVGGQHKRAQPRLLLQSRYYKSISHFPISYLYIL